jgi:hypothetical protein
MLRTGRRWAALFFSTLLGAVECDVAQETAGDVRGASSSYAESSGFKFGAMSAI